MTPGPVAMAAGPIAVAAGPIAMAAGVKGSEEVRVSEVRRTERDRKRRNDDESEGEVCGSLSLSLAPLSDCPRALWRGASPVLQGLMSAGGTGDQAW